MCEMSLRTALFIDYGNAFYAAREQFHLGVRVDDRISGNFRPWEMGTRMCENHTQQYPNNTPLEIEAVHVYSGHPNRRRNRTGYDAFQRQRAAWEKQSVRFHSAPLQYLPGQAPTEKEIDTMMAIDFVIGTISEDFDVGILFSADRDLMPALRFVHNHPAPSPGPTWPAGPGKSLFLWMERRCSDIFSVEATMKHSTTTLTTT